MFFQGWDRMMKWKTRQLSFRFVRGTQTFWYTSIFGATGDYYVSFGELQSRGDNIVDCGPLAVTGALAPPLFQAVSHAQLSPCLFSGEQPDSIVY